MVLRSLNRLILQSGGGSYGILIDTKNNNVNVNGVLSLKTNMYHKSTDGKDRLWYADNGTTYYKGHGNASVFTINHKRHNHDDVKKLH